MIHLKTYVIGGVVAAFVTTSVFVLLRPGPDGTSDTWGSAGGIFSLSEPATLPEQVRQSYQGEGQELLGIIPLPQQEETMEGFAADLAELLAQLTQPTQTLNTESEVDTPSGYAFIPQGLISTESAPPRTPTQQALHNYGNIVGLSLLTFADLHPQMPKTLKDQAEDRTDPLKVSALKRLAQDFSSLGDELAAQDMVPAVAANTHAALAEAYAHVGEKLIRIPDAQNDDDAFLEAVNSYNTAAENLSKQLVALVDLFGTHGVTFSSSDPGNIFMFSASSSF